MNRSKQREVVYDVLKGTVSHPTAYWVYEQAKEILPNISQGTVYRNLKELVSNGMVIKVQGVFDCDRFDACTVPHSHLVCRKCGAVIDFSPQSNSFDMSIGEIDGAKVESYSLIYHGICPICNKE